MVINKNFLLWSGIGDWGLGIGPIPNPQSPIPNPHFELYFKENYEIKN